MSEPAARSANPTDAAGRALPGDPGEDMTVTLLLAGYASAGFDQEMSVTGEGRVRCRSCGRDMDPHEVQLESLRRIEGASDPDDMQAVIALTCPHCGAHGAMTLAYGPSGSPEDGDVLLALDDHRQGSDLAASSSPADAPTPDTTEHGAP
jgi:hypothetical protein